MKTVLITGASRGIGAASARLFKKHGYNVIINYNNSYDKAELLAKELGATALKADVSDKSQVEAMFSEIEKTFGGVDVLVNNAGIAQIKLFSDITEEEWDKMFDINVKGMFNCTKAALSHMIHQKNGKIIKNKRNKKTGYYHKKGCEPPIDVFFHTLLIHSLHYSTPLLRSPIPPVFSLAP